MFTTLVALPSSLAASGVNPSSGDWGLPLLAGQDSPRGFPTRIRCVYEPDPALHSMLSDRPVTALTLQRHSGGPT